MLRRGPLGAPPVIDVHVVREHGLSKAGFLRVRHVELKNRYADATESAAYHYFLVERELLDAVAIVLYQKSEDGFNVVVRSQLRPPLAFRGEYRVPLDAQGTGAVQWEIPAGLVELHEEGEAGLFERAAAEAREEVGYSLAPERFSLLGHATSLSPGLVAEKLHFVCAELRDDDPHTNPTGDGHAVEEHSESVLVPLDEALKAVDDGLIHDLKTEVALFRLHAKLEGRR
jgi:ADP-ribose pyrophosphatase